MAEGMTTCEGAAQESADRLLDVSPAACTHHPMRPWPRAAAKGTALSAPTGRQVTRADSRCTTTFEKNYGKPDCHSPNRRTEELHVGRDRSVRGQCHS